MQGAVREHPRVLGWPSTAALALGGSNQSLFLIGALVLTQGSAAIPLLLIGLLMSWAAAFGWTELVLMWPNRVGGIAATCAEAFRPYSPVLANMTGVCYWWGWVPTCGITAILAGTALHGWYLPGVPVSVLATAIVLAFTLINLSGIRRTARLALPMACIAGALALLSAVIPVVAGTVDLHAATSFSLHSPFKGIFGDLTSAMAGLYLIGFAAPAFEAAACHVGETIDPARNVPRAMLVSGGVASLYFIALPVIWLGVLGPHGLAGDLTQTLPPTFAPLLVGGAKGAAVWFIVLNMFHGTLQPLAGPARTLAQLSEDGLLPRSLARRSRTDAPWVATLVTAAASIVCLQVGDPTWLIAAANFTYLIGIGLPSIAVWLLRRNHPELERPYRAPRGTIGLGIAAAVGWATATVFGFEQFGLPTVLVGVGLAYSGALAYAWRRWSDRRSRGQRGFVSSLHLKLTGSMLLVIALDGAGYLTAVSSVPNADPALVTVLEDIFVLVAMLSVSVGLILPGMISHAAAQLAEAAARLTHGTIADLTAAMQALGRGELSAARARADITPVQVLSRDEVGSMAASFNTMQLKLADATGALDQARSGLSDTRARLQRNIEQQAGVARIGQAALEGRPPAALFDDAVLLLNRVLTVDIASVFELQEGDIYLARASSGGPPGLLEQRGWEAPADHARPVVIENHALDAARRLPDELRQAGIISSARVPIESERGLWGVLAVHSMRRRRFTSDEVDFMRAVANVLAGGIDRQRSEQETLHRSLHDPLTGLPNRALFADRLGIALAGALRSEARVAVLFLDLDNFKLINDTHGHGDGDRLLVEVGARLSRALRPGDTVARFGGDEFVLICTGLSGAADALRVAERMSAALADPVRVSGAERYVTASIGVAVSIGAGQIGDDLIRDADAAMYRAKELGRGRCELFDENMRERARTRLELHGELRQAIDQQELRMHYQPVVSLVDLRTVGFEALMRWAHPERGMVMPDQFIPIAEDTGLIIPMGGWALGAACERAVAWLKGGDDQPFVAVNLSARQLSSAGLFAVLEESLATSGLPPRLLHLEITESVLLEESAAPLRVLQRLKDLGLRIVLDDFGTGYSSLAYLQRFPIDDLKIDRAFIAALDGPNPEAPAIVEAIINMARGLGVNVIAEGVETQPQADTLRALGCELAQGYLFSRPVAAAHVEALLGARGQPKKLPA